METKRIKFSIEFDVDGSPESLEALQSATEAVENGEFAAAFEGDGFSNVIAKIEEV